MFFPHKLCGNTRVLQRPNKRQRLDFADFQCAESTGLPGGSPETLVAPYEPWRHGVCFQSTKSVTVMHLASVG